MENKTVKIDLSLVSASEYKCPKCQSILIEHELFPKHADVYSMYCKNVACPIKRIKIFTVG